MIGKSRLLKLSNIRDVFQLLGDVRELRFDPCAARQRIADGLCELTTSVHGFTLDLIGMRPKAELLATRMVIGGHPDHRGLEYLIESQRQNHFRYIDPTTAWAQRCRCQITAQRNTDMFSRRLWENHPYFREHFQPAGLGALMIAFYRKGTNSDALGISLARPRGEAGYTWREQQLVELFIHELHKMYQRGHFDPPETQEQSALKKLSTREKQIAGDLLMGFSIKQVAARKGLSRHTVEHHVKHIHLKLQVNTRAELLARYCGNRHQIGSR